MNKRKQSTIARLPSETIGQQTEKKEKRVGESLENNEAQLLAFIKKGGVSARPVSKQIRQRKRKFTFRIKEEIAVRIEKAVSAREIQTNNTTWITEAILEKLKREHF